MTSGFRRFAGGAPLMGTVLAHLGRMASDMQRTRAMRLGAACVLVCSLGACSSQLAVRNRADFDAMQQVIVSRDVEVTMTTDSGLAVYRAPGAAVGRGIPLDRVVNVKAKTRGATAALGAMLGAVSGALLASASGAGESTCEAGSDHCLGMDFSGEITVMAAVTGGLVGLLVGTIVGRTTTYTF